MGGCRRRITRILPHLPALLFQLAGACSATTTETPGTGQVTGMRAPGADEVIGNLRAHKVTLTYDPQARTLRTEAPDAVAVTIDRHH